MDGPTFQTDRLVLRPMRPDDADDWWQVVWSDADVTRYLPTRGPIPREQMDRRVRWVGEHWATHGFGVWAVTESGDLVGHCGLIVNEPPDVELIYALGHGAWGRGLATEAASRVVDHGFGELDLTRLIALVFPENRPSSRVLEKLGAAQDGTVSRFGAQLVRYVITRP